MFERLKEVELRYGELERLIGDPTVIANRREFAKLSRERSQLEEIVLCYRERQMVEEDLAEHKARTPIDVAHHSGAWHAAFRAIQFGRLPAIAVLRGAVIGGGLELAMACHVRVAEPGAFYQLPEGRRGIFVGGGASVRVARVIGADRMTEMMLTGRRFDAAEGQRLGLSHYLVGAGEGDRRARELARDIAGNAPVSNWLILRALAEIADMPASAGYFAESLSAAVAQSAPEAQAGLAAFLARNRRPARAKKPGRKPRRP
ncbi:MAG: crotonase/enoyl-CoA hydratase family protein [Rhodospirillales bacterium]|nr:crotonase/enoyl-CoA hydratase family protein [Rhodospirillales bacterium]